MALNHAVTRRTSHWLRCAFTQAAPRLLQLVAVFERAKLVLEQELMIASFSGRKWSAYTGRQIRNICGSRAGAWRVFLPRRTDEF